MKILGLDCGASFTKAVIWENHHLIYHNIVSAKTPLPRFDQQFIAQDGNEFNCLAQGGLWLSQKTQAVVVSCGTGTAIVLAKKNQPALHLGGTGIGGGTLQGLGRLILNKNINQVFSLARKGNRNLIDLTVGDILNQTIGLLNPNTTAANFGKLKSKKPQDVAAGLIGLVAETIGVTACLAAKPTPQLPLIFVGRLSTNPLIKKSIAQTCQLFSRNPIFPPNATYAVALGAALLAPPKSSAKPTPK